jgi:flagellar motor switch protein FliN/FliY
VKSGRLAYGHGGPHLEDVNRILNIEVPIIVQLSERTMPLSDILDLTPGSIIEFTKPSDGELELKVNNKIIGSGQAVKVGENFGLRVARIGSLRERIQALGGA